MFCFCYSKLFYFFRKILDGWVNVDNGDLDIILDFVKKKMFYDPASLLLDNLNQLHNNNNVSIKILKFQKLT